MSNNHAIACYGVTKVWWVEQYKKGVYTKEVAYAHMRSYLECMVDNGLCSERFRLVELGYFNDIIEGWSGI